MYGFITLYETYVNASGDNFFTLLLILILAAILLKILAMRKHSLFTPILYIIVMFCLFFHIVYYIPIGAGNTVQAMGNEQKAMQLSAEQTFRDNTNGYTYNDLKADLGDCSIDLFE